jgi:outer membrane protein assembly factor BamB
MTVAAVPFSLVRVFVAWQSLVLFGLLSGTALAGDWPQILGPERNGRATDEQLATTWPEGGPRMVWQSPVGRGFAGVAVRKGRLVLFHREGNQLVAESREAATGRSQWKTGFATTYSSTISPDDGPRCVPLVDKDQVYLLGPGGELACLALATGKQIWLRNICKEFKAPEGYFGTGSSPILEGDKLLVNVGGRDGAGLVAFSPTDGKTLWKATDEAASYSSPVAATVAGVRHVIFVTRLNVVSIDPTNGEVRFRFPFGARGPTVNAASPLVIDDHLFVSASYGVGAQWAKIGAREAKEVWANDDVMSSQYTTCVEREGILYGIDGRQDVGVARLRAFDPRTGRVLWTEEGFGTGGLILVGDKLLIMRTEGELVLAEASPQEFRPLSRAKLFETTAQALPALADGLAFVRDTRVLKCVDVGQKSLTGR